MQSCVKETWTQKNEQIGQSHRMYRGAAAAVCVVGGQASAAWEAGSRPAVVRRARCKRAAD